MNKVKGRKAVVEQGKILASDLDGPIFLLLFFPRRGMRKFLKRLQQEGFGLLIITARWGLGLKVAHYCLDFWGVDYLEIVGNTPNGQKTGELEKWQEVAFLESNPEKAEEIVRNGTGRVILLSKRDNLPPSANYAKNQNLLFQVEKVKDLFPLVMRLSREQK